MSRLLIISALFAAIKSFSQDLGGSMDHFGTYPSERLDESIQSHTEIFLDTCDNRKTFFEWDEEYDGEFQKDSLPNGDIILSFYYFFINASGELDKQPVTVMRLYGPNYASVEFLKVEYDKKKFRDEKNICIDAQNLLERLRSNQSLNGHEIANIIYELFWMALCESHLSLDLISQFYSVCYGKFGDAEVNETLSVVKRLLSNNRIELHL